MKTVSFFVGLGALLFAQKTAVILARKGDVKVQDPTKGWVTASVGMRVAEEQEIQLGPNSYVALSMEGKAREIKTPGIHKVQKIFAQTLPADNNPKTSRYTNYVINQSLVSNSGRNNMKNLGSTTRTLAPPTKTPKQAYQYPDKALFQWERVAGANGYIFEIINDKNEVIFSKETEEPQITVDLRPHNLKPNTCYFWRVATRRLASVKSTDICFKILSPEKAAALQSEENELRQTLDLNTALGNAILGAFYEENNLTGYALEAYEKAMAIEPQAEGYKNLREGLLQK
ncbi:MAG: hypothetical protein ACUVRD_06470 [Bacteroidia bacterium]